MHKFRAYWAKVPPANLILAAAHRVGIFAKGYIGTTDQTRSSAGGAKTDVLTAKDLIPMIRAAGGSLRG